ncbi:beta-ketoacyl-[acyl-carrier-protein] synthase family protein [Micromonospora sp. FIMYZ51]|uniref:beta-ketoacyl-[acyl-carrier-protein] synthase family protein n=1 Tax=Micromonospora sp. FIMYZ51 TaxID=3051832 RepID=UPI00311F304A
MRRVLVTGLGPVSSIGIGVRPFAAGLRAGRSGISPIASFDAEGFPHRHAGEVPDFDPGALLRTLDVGQWGRSSLFAAAAARLAVTDADLDLAAIDADRAGAAIGTTSGESVAMEQLTAQRVTGGFAAMDAVALRQLPAARLAHAVSAELGLRGESVTIATACSASNYAIGYAYDLIATGDADVMLAGGADSVCRWAHAGFYRLGALAERECRPFDRDRGGILTGEGGAVLLLESAEHAQARGARGYAEVRGYGHNCDAAHPVAPERSSIAECIRAAHRNAAVSADEVDYVCAHGTGTQANDAVEIAALRDVFDGRPPPVSSVKSMIGHTMGAASGFGAIASVLAIEQGFLPPTINLTHPDQSLGDIDFVANEARPAKIRVAQNNGFAFGGNNAIVVFGTAA